jgi:hypothetical protein
LILRPYGNLFHGLDVRILVKSIYLRLSAEKVEIRFFEEELAGEVVAVVNAVDDDGGCIVGQSMRTAVADGGLGFVEMTENVLITLDAFFLTFRVSSMELRTHVLPRGCRQNMFLVVDNGRGEGIDLVQFVLKHLELLNINEVLKSECHRSL